MNASRDMHLEAPHPVDFGSTSGLSQELYNSRSALWAPPKLKCTSRNYASIPDMDPYMYGTAIYGSCHTEYGFTIPATQQV